MEKLDHLIRDVGRVAGRTWLAGMFAAGIGLGAANAQEPCLADAGSLSGEATTTCFTSEGAVITAIPGEDAIVPDGYSTVYVLTSGESLVVHGLSDAPEFMVTDVGLYTVHSLVYDPLTLDLSIIEIGVSTGADLDLLLVQGGGTICASLDLEGFPVLVADPDAGGLTAVDSEVCYEGMPVTIAATSDADMYVPEGFNVVYLLTMGEGLVITAAAETPAFEVEAPGMYTLHTFVYDPLTFDIGMVEYGITTGFEVHEMLVQGGGTICASLDASGAMVEVVVCGDICEVDAGELTVETAEVCMDEGSATLQAFNIGVVAPEGYLTAYVLTTGAEHMVHQVSGTPEFMVDMTGPYSIHTVVYDPLTLDLEVSILPGVTTAGMIEEYFIMGGGTLCGAFDMTGVVLNVIDCDIDCMANAGGLVADSMEVCMDGMSAMIGASSSGGLMVPEGYEVGYVLTSGDDLVIHQLGATASFTVDMTGSYTIHTLVYDPLTLDLGIVELGVTTAGTVNSLLLQGGGDICASLDVTGAVVHVIDCDMDCMANAGGLTANSVEVCMEGTSAIIGATPSGGIMVPEGYEVGYVLTSGDDLVIHQLGTTASFTVNMMGDYTIHTLVYDPLTLDLGIVELGVTTAATVNSLLLQGGGDICASLDITGAVVHVIDCDEDDCLAWAGSLMPLKDVFCYMETGSVIGATVVGDAVVPPGYQIAWIATHGDDHVIEEMSPMAWFNVEHMGLYTIHTLVYNPATLDLSVIDWGTTTAAELNALLIQGGGSICASLDLDGVSMVVDSPVAGTITPDMTTVCLEGGSAMISATVSDTYLPMGYEHQYVLTMGNAQTIVDISSTPAFEVDMLGNYSIHTLVVDVSTFPLDEYDNGLWSLQGLYGNLVEGGGIYCAALDMEGASIVVMNCDVECPAYAGTLQGYKPVFCYEEEGTYIGAIIVGDAVVPPGYEIAYLATHGEDMVIEHVNMDAPYFTVYDDGLYTIHTLVYDPATLDLSTVDLGVTTAHMINDMLVQGGGEICASLDMDGVWLVIDTPVAGTVTATSTEVCLEGGMATVGATASGSYLPLGYTHMYVLTMGDDMVVVDTSFEPTFNVTATGSYTVHTLVHDPNTFAYDAIVPGTSTIYSLNDMLVQGGGLYCAALDMEGAMVMVTECDGTECVAYAGTLDPNDLETCLFDTPIIITATGNADMVVPAGYEVAYALTHGTAMTIVGVSDELSFEVAMAGDYTFHTLVYHPMTLDLSLVEVGVTTAAELNALLIQGGGLICASLDVTGGTTHVIDCSVDCTADAGLILPADALMCMEEGMATLTGVPTIDPMVPAGYEVVYVLTTGLDPIILASSTEPTFVVEAMGNYRIHTLVYDPATLDLTMVEYGVTSAMELNAMLIQGGGSVCASLDLLGAMFMVNDCEECTAYAGTLMAEATEVCMVDGEAILAAVGSGDIVVPTGYSTLYVLTHTELLTIVDVGDVPQFTVDLEGNYMIHTLVYDPNTLDLGGVIVGTTSAAELLAQLIGSGGSICASLDIEGASIAVVDCTEGLAVTNAWPVPAMEQLTVELNIPATSTTEMVVVDMNGSIVLPTRTIGAGTTQVVLDVSSLESGMYMIRMMSADGLATYNFSKAN